MVKIKYTFFFLLLFVLVSCKTTHSAIITSKDEAVKKGIYSKPVAEKKSIATVSSKNKSSQEVAKNKKPVSKKSVLNEDDDTVYVEDKNISYFIQQLIHNAMQYNGVKYRGGGTTFDGMDCSGLVSTVFKSYDISLPRSSNDMAKVGKKLSRDEIQVGDLVFFRTNGKKVINHVGLVTEINGDEIVFIHSSVQKGVIISSTKEPYYQRTFAQANRVLSDEYF